MFFWFRAEIWTSVDAMTFSFAHRLILEHHWPRGPNEIFAPRPEISLGVPGGRQPVGHGPTVGLLAIFRGPRAIRFYKVFVGRMLAANKR